MCGCIDFLDGRKELLIKVGGGGCRGRRCGLEEKMRAVRIPRMPFEEFEQRRQDSEVTVEMLAGRREQELVTLLPAVILFHCCVALHHSQAASSNVCPPLFLGWVFCLNSPEVHGVCPPSVFLEFRDSPGSMVAGGTQFRQ